MSGTRAEYERFQKKSGTNGASTGFEKSLLPHVHPSRGFYNWLIQQDKHENERIRKLAEELAYDEVAKVIADDDAELREHLRLKVEPGTINLCSQLYLATLPKREFEEVETETAKVIEVIPYPIDVWSDTQYGLFAAMMTKGNFIPPEFCVEAIKTVVGAIVGNRVSGNFQGGNLRQFTVLIGIPGKGKGEANREPIKAFKNIVREIADGIRNTDLVTAVAQPSYKHIGVMLANPASDVAVIEAAKICSRLLHNPSEFSEVLSKLAIDGAALPSVIRELFDSTYISPSTTAKRKTASEETRCLYSLLSTTQPTTFADSLSRHGGIGAGLASRLTLVRNDERRTVAALPEVDWRPFLEVMLPKIQALERQQFNVSLSDAAKTLIDEWWKGLGVENEEESEEIRPRLNVIVLRNALHLAWLRDSHVIEGEDMEKAIKLGNYQLGQRRSLVAPATDNVFASHQLKIIGFIRRNGPSTTRQIFRGVHALRVGTKMHREAVDGLCNGPSPQLIQRVTSHVNSFIFSLIKYGDES